MILNCNNSGMLAVLDTPHEDRYRDRKQLSIKMPSIAHSSKKIWIFLEFT